MTSNGYPGLLRPRYFDRQQLRAADLTVGQTYVVERLRRHNRFLHGWGVVCGAVVTPGAGPAEVVVSAGYALSPHGNEVHLPEDTQLDLAEQILACLPVQPRCADPDLLDGSRAGPPEAVCVDFTTSEEGRRPNPFEERGFRFEVFDAEGRPRDSAEVFGGDGLDVGFHTTVTLPEVAESLEVVVVHGPAPTGLVAFDGRTPVARATVQPADTPTTVVLTAVAMTHLTVTTSENEARLAEICGVPRGGLREVYLVARPRSEQVCPQPAVPADCGPPGAVYEPSRIHETHELTVVCDLPESHTAPVMTCDEARAVVCEDALPVCPPLPVDDDVVLARLVVGRRRLGVDNVSHRRRLLSSHLLQAFQACGCRPGPTPEPTAPPTTAPPTTAPTRFTLPTEFTRPTLFTRPTVFTRPTLFTGPTLFTRPPITRPPVITRPTRPPLPTLEPIDPVGRPRVFDLDPEEFDLFSAARTPVEEVPGIGEQLGSRLRAAGVGSVLEFAGLPVDRATEVLGVSAVRVAELQSRAREAMRSP